MTDRIVIVGGGLAAARVARAFRDAGGEEPVTILSADVDPPYNRPPLSKGFLRGEMDADAVFVEPAAAYAELRHRPAPRLHRHGRPRRTSAPCRWPTAARCPTTGSCSRPARCRARSGRRARTLAGVHTYRTLRDASAVRAAAESASTALVIGGGFIGMETTASLRRRGLEVTQVDLADHLYASLQAPPLSASLERLYRERGVDVILGDVVAEFRGSDGKLSGRSRRPGARSRPSSRSSASACSRPPATSRAPASSSSSGTVVVDERFASSVPGIWAVGDIANFSDPVFGHRRLIQHWTNANHQGDRLGRLLAGPGHALRPGRVLLLRGLRHEDRPARRSRGRPRRAGDARLARGGRLIGWYLRDGRLAAALIVGQTPDFQNELDRAVAGAGPLVDRAALGDPAEPPSRRSRDA